MSKATQAARSFKKITVYWCELDLNDPGWAFRAIDMRGQEDTGPVEIRSTANLSEAIDQACYELGTMPALDHNLFATSTNEGEWGTWQQDDCSACGGLVGECSCEDFNN